ncbi:DUF3632 domain-containing protein [Aspergillus luchuensis]|uniref:Similar to An07g01340 n=1 Tax=Aspergillus kawachii TaxID=1069201 RepID=A0A146EZZ4_ASPKA|nr:uncharacterized protein AKAW2_12008A [Aspergillus luchuensis]BCR94962.1 hypothetical protein AKAW2_12008A [Aspergillus luchuensis]BCS07535.1 hypothetical protein ALUC_11916A [Aspergillus luchuensis]GAA86027.1 similar to An07g01340 [Aspergillus luchuensis IFO 4308]GAT19530.1 similar to An07g01340 [Aspergillus luchuensis]
MDHVRDSLLSSLPRDSPSTAAIDHARRDQEDTRQAVARGEYQEVRDIAFSNRTWVVTSRYCDIGDGVDSLEGHIHSLWYMYYELGRTISSDSPEHEGLVLDILRIQGMGPLTRPSRGVNGIDIARTVDGTLWNDLPFLVGDMTDFWINHSASMSGTHRLNFATFLAKLASTRVAKDRLGQVALLIFHSLFESPLQLRSGKESDEEDVNRGTKQLEVFHLLPSAVAWLKIASHNLLLLSEVYWNDCPSHISKGGATFVGSDLGQRSPTGFSSWRYMFWLRRLHELQDEAKQAGEKALEELAADGIQYMVNTIKDRNSEVLRAYKNGGDELHQDKYLSCLKTLARVEE